MIRKLVFLVFVLSFGLGTNVFAQTRIRFARGEVSASVSGSIATGSVRRFVLRSPGGQELTGGIRSLNECVKFSKGSTSIALRTVSEDNWISITNYCERPMNFVLTVSIN
jgi:hypothetical protein